MHRKKIRIHRSRNLVKTEPNPSYQVSEESPSLDIVKKYLANLEEDHFNGQAKSTSNFSFDLSLAQWKSKAKLRETVPVDSIYQNQSVCLYSEQPEMILQRRREEQESEYLPNLTQLKNFSQQKSNGKKLFLNFQRKANISQSDNKTSSPNKKWLKPMIFSLDEDNPCKIRKFSFKKHMKQNPTTTIPRYDSQQEFPLHLSASHQIHFTEAKPLHGIHCFRNKFELILNSRSIKQRAFKLFRYSNPRTSIPLSIENRKLQ